jgi:hypothetical protein
MHVSINNASQFRDEFHKCGRGKQFSYEALGLLYDFLTELDGSGELDVIAICCEYTEDTEEAIMQAYGLHEDEDVTTFLEENTLVVGVTASGTVVYQQF